MNDLSIFSDKDFSPTQKDIEQGLGPLYSLWNRIGAMVLEKYPTGLCEWNFSGKKYGWNYRIKDKKRAIIYLLPRTDYFIVAFVFGEKAINHMEAAGVDPEIIQRLLAAKKYAEGRGIRIDVHNEDIIPQIDKLIDIKMAF